MAMTLASAGGRLRVHPDLVPLLVPLDRLRPHPRNARVHDDDAIEESLRVNGMYRPVVVNRGTMTGRPDELLAGHGAWHAAHALEAEAIPVTWVDVTEEDAARILLVDNRTNDLAKYEDGVLAQLLTELVQVSDLSGTGFDQDALDRLVADNERDTPLHVKEPEPITCPNCGHQWRDDG